MSRALVTAFAFAALSACYRERVVYVTSPYVAPPQTAVVRDDEDPICIDTFQPALSPYGTWVDDDVYGLIWVPSVAVVGEGYTPYVSAGHWTYSSQGYIWTSDHEWGWMTFHYGRWMFIGSYGWVWVPGARYAPSWVEWRYGGGYIGWAPMRPAWRWRGRVAYHVVAPPAPYVFVHSHVFFRHDMHLYVAPPADHPALYASTSRWIAPPAQSFVGPPPAVVGIPKEHVVGATIAPPAQAKPSAIPWGKPPVMAPPPPVNKAPPPVYTPAPNPMPPPTIKPSPPPVFTPPPTIKPSPAPTVKPKISPPPKMPPKIVKPS
jgi:hypothetical protein